MTKTTKPTSCSSPTNTPIKTNPKVDTLLYTSGAIIWHLKKKHYGKSKMNDLIRTKLYKNMTIRNVNTVQKLQNLISTKT